MMVPVRCFTCGKVVGDKWEYFLKRVVEKKEDAKKVLDELGIERYCCRRTIFSHADTIDEIMKYPS